MTNEYKLSYTASDIDAKLGKVDEHEVSINTLSERISNLGSSSGGVTSWNDLEDKPFYDDESVFELDGDITGKVSVQFSTNSYFVKISDETPRFELGDEIHFVYNKGNTLNFVISEDVFDPEEPYYKEGEYIIPYYFAVAYKDGATANLGADDFVFPEAGLYVTFSTSSIDPEGTYITKLSFGEFKLLDKKFIPEGILGVKSWNDLKDRPFGELGISYSSVEDVVIAPDSTNSSIKLRNVGEVINRRPYWHENAYIEIIINGASFITLASDLPALESVGNAMFCTYSGVNIGGKFAKDRTTGNYTITFNFSGTFDEQVTFSAYYGSIQTVQIDPKYIPEVPHTHSFNDLEDRPFYDETTVIEWDGDTTGKTVLVSYESMLVKVSDKLPTHEELKNATLTFGGNTITKDFTENVVDEVMYTEGEVLVTTGLIVAYIALGDMGDGAILNEPGVYFIKMGEQYTSLFQYGTVKTLDAKFLPDNIGGGVTMEEVQAYIDEALIGGAW